MGFLFVAALFHLIVIGMIVTTGYLVFIFTKAVCSHQHVPAWMYKMGHALKGRGVDSLEDLTDTRALAEAYLFLCGFAVFNVVWYFVMLSRGHNVYKAAFLCLKQEFFICLVVMALHTILHFFVTLIRRYINKSYQCHNYASTQAIVGMVFLSCFAHMLALSFTGVPAKPYNISLAQSNIVIGTTHASELLQQGFIFENKQPDDLISNQRTNHFYYEQSFKLTRKGISYGVINVTPQWSTTAKLKDCIITSYAISRNDSGFHEVYLENRQLSELTWQSIQGKRLVDIFNLTPADYREVQGENYISLQLQTYPYVLWKRYLLEGTYTSTGEPDYFEIRTGYTVWE